MFIVSASVKLEIIFLLSFSYSHITDNGIHFYFIHAQFPYPSSIFY